MRKRSPAAVALTIIAAFVLQSVAARCVLGGSESDARRRLRGPDLESIADIVRGEIEAGRIVGAVVEIGQGEEVVYRRAFGYRELEPAHLAMRPDTIFDLASLTKPLATSIAIKQLYESGKIDFDAPAANYWPTFGRGGKDHITVRELMTHYSGLKPDLDLERKWSGYGTALKMIEAQRPICPPGTRYVYSDINFEVLGEIVRRVAGVPLDIYCGAHVFGPLRMVDTGFRPPLSKRCRIAPTQYVNGRLRLGEVHDPTAARMGGVAGHAGLFSTADDLATLARMLLDGGRARGARILTSRSIDEMTIPESPMGAIRLRGLGWDLAAPLASNRDHLKPVGSYGHSGFTGTMLWVDPVSVTYVIILANRTYPDGGGDAGPLRNAILTLVSDRLGPLTEERVVANRPALRAFEATATRRDRRAARAGVATGIDVLVADGLQELKGRHVGLITNQTGVTKTGIRDIDAFSHASGLTLVAIFNPEHGLYGEAEDRVASAIEPATLLPVHSLYGELKRPSDAMLDRIDALVFDVQDSGARFYTYATTMAYAMEAAARHGIDFYVLDRPNPISAEVVQGPVMDPKLKSFTGYFSLPTRHGMAAGELAEMFNHENRIAARLHVVRMRGYRRYDWYDETGLNWVAPSPNLRTLVETALYPGVGMIEGANVSVGRGTPTPFELVGAPWIDADELSAYLNRRKLPGIHFEPATFSPSADRHANRVCHGVRIVLDDRYALDSPALGVELITALYRLYPHDFKVDATLGMVGSSRAIEAIKAGDDPKSVASQWQSSLERFRLLRSRYLLY